MNQSKSELCTHDSERLEQIFVIRRQPVDPRREDRLYGRRNLQLAKRLDEPDCRAVARNRAFVEQHLNHLLHEERVTLGLFNDEFFERRQVRPLAE